MLYRRNPRRVRLASRFLKLCALLGALSTLAWPGQAQPLSIGVWNYTALQIPPGSTLVVPKERAPFNLLAAAQDLTQLVSQLAVTAASLAVIGRN
jgi:hypothetical protein